MLPKQAFFIWLGGNKPSYVDFARRNFQEVNPDYKFDLIECDSPETSNDELIKEAYSKAVREITVDLKMDIDKCKRSFVFMKASNHLRFIILKKYGGIFLDADTFPIKPFDDSLLQTDFRITRSYNNNESLFEEIFFLGMEKNSTFSHPRLLYPCDSYCNQQFNYLKPKFFDCTLKYGQYFGNPRHHYIDHYNDYSWS